MFGAESFVDVSGLVRMSSFFLLQEEYPSCGSFISCFRKQKERPECPSAPAVSQVPLIQKFGMPEWAYFVITFLISFNILPHLPEKNKTNSPCFFRSEYSENYKTFLCFTFMSCSLLVLGWNKSEIFDMPSKTFDAIVQWVEPENWDKNIILSFHF